MSLRSRARDLPHLANAYRALRRGYRTAFRSFPLSWLLYLRFGRSTPIAPEFGLARGQPIDRYYIERFLARHRADVSGRVLEVRDDSYTRRFGSAVERSDVLDLSPVNARATIIGDMAESGTLPRGAFDCAIVTQTLQLIPDLRAAIGALHDSLRPGGVLLATVPGISKIASPSPEEGEDLYHDCWRFTRHGALRLFRDVFPAENLEVRSFGNVLASVAFLHGVSVEEIGPGRLDLRDDEYQLLIAIRAVKPREG